MNECEVVEPYAFYAVGLTVSGVVERDLGLDVGLASRRIAIELEVVDDPVGADEAYPRGLSDRIS